MGRGAPGIPPLGSAHQWLPRPVNLSAASLPAVFFSDVETPGLLGRPSLVIPASWQLQGALLAITVAKPLLFCSFLPFTQNFQK